VIEEVLKEMTEFIGNLLRKIFWRFIQNPAAKIDKLSETDRTDFKRVSNRQ